MEKRIKESLSVYRISFKVCPIKLVMKICHLFLFQISYMISAWARMCKILGKEFHQYLPLVMPPVMKAASLKPEVALLDSKYTISHATCNESCLTETRSDFIRQ
jgi:hypothetical protein